MGSRSNVHVLSLAVPLAASLFGVARAAPPISGAAVPAQKPPLTLERLEAELQEQRKIILQVMQVEQQHYDLLLRLIQNAPGASPAVAPETAGPVGPAASPLPSTLVGPETPAPAAPRRTPDRTATVTGRVALPGGVSEAYVFVQNVRGAPVRGRVVEIAQRDRQFHPTVAVVQRGTRIVFPNYDALFHNVFSPSAPHPFDLGSYRAGESPRSVEMTSPGVIEIYCNMHAKMHATILVVPNGLWTRVGPDGTFRLDNIPVGTRKLVAWSPRTLSADQTLEVGPSGGTATFALTLAVERAHNNKQGIPYTSYE